MSRLIVLVTGGAGFIGSHVVDALLESGQYEVYCVDNFDPFYDPAIKLNNLQKASRDPYYHFIELDLRITAPAILINLFRAVSFDAIIHLAARAGVRPSIANPAMYYDVNVKGTLHLLEFAKLAGIRQFLFASSSSVYGNNPNVPWKESDLLYRPISPYAGTKLAAEEMGKVYAQLYDIHFVALRLFTVYGPRQRPDLAIHQFYNLIKAQQPINLFGDGNTKRDYTYISDIVSGIIAALSYQGKGDTVFNLGNNKQIELTRMIHSIEECMQTKAIINWQSEQPGDVNQTYADISKAGELLNYHPVTNFEDGIRQ
ncbi:MAG TPA: GDP-mannose 4,6-dehydratase, partial [Chitinophagaceae bacterium]|nr:GDP-mannose 4,6-dehydratase [Chitinophagaceae bacterium]